MKRLIIALALTSLLALLLAACGGSGAAAPDAAGNLTVEMSEYKFTPDNIELKVGQKVTITLVNMGEKDHEFMVGRDVAMMEGAPNGFEHDLFENAQPMVMGGQVMGMEGMEGDSMADDAMESKEGDEMADMGGHMDHSGFMVVMPQGNDNATITFDVTEDMVGEWEIGCFEDDGQHYDDGMKGKIVVKQ